MIGVAARAALAGPAGAAIRALVAIELVAAWGGGERDLDEILTCLGVGRDGHAPLRVAADLWCAHLDLAACDGERGVPAADRRRGQAQAVLGEELDGLTVASTRW